MGEVRRVYVEKKKDYAVKAKELHASLKQYLGLDVESVRVLVRYDIENLSDASYEKALVTVFSEPPVDDVYEETLPLADGEISFSVEFLPGQFDQRADSAQQCVKLLNEDEDALIRSATTYVVKGDLTDEQLEAVDRGVDFFDCVYPTRNGRHGHVYTNQGKLNMFNKKYELDHRPIEEGCQCPACRSYSRAYIRHLLKAKEMLGMRLCVLHNLYFYNHMMEEIRDALDAGNFAEYKKMRLEGFEEGKINSKR